MGNATSSHLQHTPLAPQSRFPRVVNARFALSRTATLRLPFGFWRSPDDLELRDEETGAVMFKVKSSRPSVAPKEGETLAAKTLLLDKNGVPVASMEAYPVGEDYAMYVPMRAMSAGLNLGMGAARAASADEMPVWQESRVLCYLQMNTRPMEKRLLIELEDPVTREPLQIRVEGTWQNREALFWLKRGTQRQCIARVYVDDHVRQRLKEKKQQQKHHQDDVSEEYPASLYYCVGVAPGVDIAMIVLACAALDEELAKKESGEIVEIPTDDVTRMLALRHNCTGDRNRSHSRSVATARLVIDT